MVLQDILAQLQAVANMARMALSRAAGARTPGVEVLTASDSNPPISLEVGVTILVNHNDATTTFHLPDGTDGVVKEIMSGGPTGSEFASTTGCFITCTNSAFGGNDGIDLPVDRSVRLVWASELGGWCLINTNDNAQAAWD